MDSAGILVDTTILIDYLRKRDKDKTFLRRVIDVNDLEIFNCSVCCFEVLMGVNNNNSDGTDSLLNRFHILEFDFKAAIEAAKIYQTLKKESRLIEFRDIFIVSIAIANNLALATINSDHFIRIEALKLMKIG